jgi:hypothetical protein
MVSLQGKAKRCRERLLSSGILWSTICSGKTACNLPITPEGWLFPNHALTGRYFVIGAV